MHRQDADFEALFLHHVKVTSLQQNWRRDGFCPTPLVVTKLLNNLFIGSRQIHYTAYFLFQSYSVSESVSHKVQSVIMPEFGPSDTCIHSSLPKGTHISRRELHLFNTQNTVQTAALHHDLREHIYRSFRASNTDLGDQYMHTVP